MANDDKKRPPTKQAAPKKKAAAKKKAAPKKKASAKSTKATSASSTSTAPLTAQQKLDLKQEIHFDVMQVFALEADMALDSQGVKLFNTLLERTLDKAVKDNKIDKWTEVEKAYVYPHVRAIACRASSAAKSGNRPKISRADLNDVADPWIREAKALAEAKLARLKSIRASKKAGSKAEKEAKILEDDFRIKTKYCDGYS